MQKSICLGKFTTGLTKKNYDIYKQKLQDMSTPCLTTTCRRISTPYRLVVSKSKFLFVCESHIFFGSTLYYSRLIIDKTKVLCGLIVQVPGLPSKEDCPGSFISWVSAHQPQLDHDGHKVQGPSSPAAGGMGHDREVTPADEEGLTKEIIEKR